MADNSSLDASYSLGMQANKTTAATAAQTGLKQTSRMPGPDWDEYDPGPEHPGPADRNTNKRSYTQKTGYLAPFGSTGLLYPNLFGYQLRAAGFDVATVADTGFSTHTFTIADAANVPYVSAIWDLGAWSRIITGARITTLGLNATPQTIEVTDDGIGMVIGDQSGVTFTPEVAVPIKPTIGSGSIQIGGTELTTDAIRGHQFNVTQELDTEDYQLWVEGRNDVPQSSIGVAGSFDDIDITEALYQKLVNGGLGNTTPSSAYVSAAIDVLYQSSELIPTTAVPYSVEIIMPTCELNMGDFEASGENLVRFSAEYEMVDISGEPIQVILVNNVDSYATP